MSQHGGVAAFDGSWKTDTFHTNSKEIDLQVEQSFWSKTTTAGDGDYIVSQVRVKNTGNVSLSDVKVWIDLDDNTLYFDAYPCDASGTIVSDPPCLGFGNIAPGETSGAQSYWWTLRRRLPGETGQGTHQVRLIVDPQFTVRLNPAQAFESTSQLEAS